MARRKQVSWDDFLASTAVRRRETRYNCAVCGGLILGKSVVLQVDGVAILVCEGCSGRVRCA